MLPSLFSFYIADRPRPTEPVKRVCYADDITVWPTGVKIPNLEDSVNNYLKRSLPRSLQSRCSAQIHTKPRPIREYSLRTHSYRCSMPKDIRSLPRHLPIIQQAQRLRSRESIQ